MSITRWRQELLEHSSEIFSGTMPNEENHQKEVDRLHRKIGELEMKVDFNKRVSPKSLDGNTLKYALNVVFCIEAIEEAIRIYGTPEIINTDQGSHYTSTAWINLLKKNNIQKRWMAKVVVKITSGLSAFGER